MTNTSIKTSLRLAVFLAFICTQSCSQDIAKPEPPESFDEVLEIASSSKNIRSLIISHQGVIIAEKYYQRYQGDSLDHLRSATKSIMTTLIGIAIDKGHIGSVDDPISKYLDAIPDDKQGIKIKHLMNMKSGLTWNEGNGYNDHNKMIDSGDPYKHMMNLPMAHRPGSKWEYSSGDIHLLSVILSQASGISTLEFAQKYLFAPLGIIDLQWQKFDDGYYAGGSRLQLKPMDMLKIGLMCVQGGMFEGRRIISQEYLETATDVIHQFSSNDIETEGYGLGWWTANIQGTKAFMASGYGGQTIAVIPSNQLVVVVTHNWQVNGENALAQQRQAMEIVEPTWLWVNR